jgi:hypothetical protein
LPVDTFTINQQNVHVKKKVALDWVYWQHKDTSIKSVMTPETFQNIQLIMTINYELRP